MDSSKHCEICDNSTLDEQKEIICSLTNMLPKFSIKCPHIKLGEKYKKVIREINIEHHLIKITKVSSYANLIVVLSVSIAIVLIGYLIGKHLSDNGVFSTVPLIVIGVGILILPLAMVPINKYRYSIAAVAYEKQQLDEILLIYDIKYTIETIKTKVLDGSKKIDEYLKIKRQ